MAASKFVIEINLGNDAMKLPQHIADALAAVVRQLPHVIAMKGASTKILDANGNSVGTWSYK